MKFNSAEKPFKGETDIWLTPKAIIDKLGPFDLDPCAAPIPRPWETAKEMISLPEDGLLSPWKGFVWLNPPYGPRMFEWIQRLALHGDGIALLFARTETSAFMENIFPHADVLLFMRGRITFHYPDGKIPESPAAAPSVLIGFGKRASRALATCTIPGYLVKPILETGHFNE